jgi:hypothetical protein
VLQEKNSHLQLQVALQDSLERAKCQVICLTDKLVKKQEAMCNVPPKPNDIDIMCHCRYLGACDI